MAEETETVQETAPDQAETEQRPDMGEELRAIFDEANKEEAEGPARGPDGKFVAKETADGEDDASQGATPEGTEETETTDQGAETEVEALDPPASWSDAEKAIWPNLTREAQEIYLRREADWQKADGERANKLKGLEPFEAALEPVRQQLALNGVDPATYIRQLVAADQYLRQQPQAAVQWLAQTYGVDLSQLSAAEVEMDPAVAPLHRELSDLKAQFTTYAQTQQQAEAQRLNSEIQMFAEQKDADGKLKHPHFAEVRQHMGALMQNGSASDMESAYEMAVWANPETRAKLQADQSAQAEAKRKEEAAERAAKAQRVSDTNLSNKGSGGGQTPPQYDSRQQELEALYDQAQGA